MADNTQRRMPTVTSAPFIHTDFTIQNLLKSRLMALAPLYILSVFAYGFRVVSLLAIGLVFSAIFHFLYCKVKKAPFSFSDLTSYSLIACILGVFSPSVPLWLPISAAFLGVFVLPLLFGDFGKSVFNLSALTILVLQAIFPNLMNDVTNSGTILPFYKNTVELQGADVFFQSIRVGRFYKFADMFLGGNAAGICTLSAILVGLSALLIFVRRAGNHIIPVSICATIFICAFIFFEFDNRFLFALELTLNAKVLYAAFFVATEYSSAPLSRSGKVIYGFICGILTAIFEFSFGEEAIFAAIVISDMLSPVIDTVTVNISAKRKSIK